MAKNKFIAWDFRNQKMVLDAVVLTETRQLITVNANYLNSPFSFFDGCVWLQFTGLLDKNKVEIYEGACDGKRTIRYSVDHAGYVVVDAGVADLTKYFNGRPLMTLSSKFAGSFEIKGYDVPKTVGSDEYVFVENPIMTRE